MTGTSKVSIGKVFYSLTESFISESNPTDTFLKSLKIINP